MMMVQIRAEKEVGGVNILTSDGYPIRGVMKAVVTMEPGNVVRAELQMVSTFVGDAEGIFMVFNPAANALKPVRKIEYADGSIWSAE